MLVEDFLNSLTKKNWCLEYDKFKGFLEINSESLSKKDLNFIVDNLQTATSNIHKRRIRNFFFCGLIFFDGKFIEQLKTKDFLIPAKLLKNAKKVKEALESLKGIDLTINSSKYLNSLLNLFAVYEIVWSLIESLKDRFKHEKPYFLCKLIGLVEAKIMLETSRGLVSKVEALSYCISLFKDSCKQMKQVSLYKVKIDDLEAILKKACFIKKYFEFEFYVRKYNYQLITELSIPPNIKHLNYLF